jgi:hypothetical protein
MVRIKVAVKDASKIPKKRLYEMQKDLYVVQFKVEEKDGVGDDQDEDGGDKNQGMEEDSGEEELDHDNVNGENKKQSDSSRKRSSNLQASSSTPTPTPGSSKRVADWSSLFQNNEER